MSDHGVFLFGFAISLVIAFFASAFGKVGDAVIWGFAACIWGSMWLETES